MLTSSFAWTSSPASVAITSLAFMFDEVPEPVWKTSIGNWSSSSPAAIRSPAAAIRSALSGVEQPELGVHARGRGLDPPEPARHGRRDRLAGDREVVDRLRGLPAPELLRPSPLESELTRPSQTVSSRRPWRSSSSQRARASRAGGRAARRAPARARRSPASPRTRRTATPRSSSSSSRSPLARRRAARPRASSSSALGRLGGVLLVRADHAARAALDPAGAVDAGIGSPSSSRTRPSSFGITPRPSSNGTPGQRDAAVADAAQDEAARDHLALARSAPRGCCRRSSATSSLRTTSTASTLPSPRIATGETQEAEHAAAAACPRASRAAYSRSRSTLRRAVPRASASSAASLAGVELEVGRVDDDVGAARARRAPSAPGGVNAACAGPRRPSITISRMPEADDRLDRRVGRVGRRELLVRCSASIRATSTATLPFPTTTARSPERSNSSSWKSGWPLYQATNSVAGHEPGRSSPGIPSRRSVCAPTV